MRDPVCGMTVGDGALTVEGYPEYGFCSGHCHDAFLAEPSRFEGESAGGETMSRQEPAEGDDEPASPSAPVVVAVATGGSETVQLAVEGMTCASCVATIERALGDVPGVLEARVNFATEEATVDVVPGAARTADLVAAVDAAGYHARPVDADSDGDEEQAGRERLYRTLMRKFWFAAVVAIPVMYFSYPELFPGIPEKGSTELNLIWGAMALATLAVMAWSGSQFFTGAWAAFKH
ncbi:MAG: cation transporter, partial [Acidobacteria bacterium]|nr:cation transporter [Acidobacteriota bacterium]